MILCVLVSAAVSKQVSFCGHFNALLFVVLCFLLVFLLFKMVPKHTAELLSVCKRLWTMPYEEPTCIG